MSARQFRRLLGVLAIIVVVAALLFPVFSKAHGCTRCPSCASNMKQLGLGLEQYAQDNDRMMPNTSSKGGGNTWRSLLSPYVKSQQLFQCPSRSKDDHDANPVGEDGYAQSYAANSTGNGRIKPDQGRGAFAGPGSRPIALADVPRPQALIALTEAAYNPFPQYNIDDARGFSPASRRFWAGHQGGSNYLFVDGHVRWLRPQDTDQEAAGKAVVNFWYRDSTLPLSANGVAVLADAQKRFGP